MYAPIDQERSRQGMLRSAASKVAWAGRTASMVFGLVLILALLFGVASTALGADGQNFILGKAKNAATKVTGLVGNVDGAAALRVTNPNAGTNDTALDLRVQAGEAPMKVNSAARVANLNADLVDGKHADQIGVNGLEHVVASSASDSSNSPKNVTAYCPSGKIAVGSGYDIVGGGSGSFPDVQTDVVVDSVYPFSNAVAVSAYEEESTSANWYVRAVAICATAP